jgi:hypothetical protein
MQARWPKDRVDIRGRHTEYVRISDGGNQRTFRFCPDCGTTVFWTNEESPDVIAVAIGTFADSSFPQPAVSVYESRRYPWLSLPVGIEGEDD